MIIDITKLVSVSTYIKRQQKPVSRQAVYKMIEKGKLESVTIDGVIFIFCK